MPGRSWGERAQARFGSGAGFELQRLAAQHVLHPHERMSEPTLRRGDRPSKMQIDARKYKLVSPSCQSEGSEKDPALKASARTGSLGLH